MKINDNYIFDIDNIMKFVFEEEQTTDSEITDLYVMDDESDKLTLSSKQVREVKGGDATNKETIRYDFIKMLVLETLGIREDDLGFGDVMLINTMLSEGLIKEVNNGE